MLRNRSLTDFQLSCEAALSLQLSAVGRSLAQRRLDGRRERYIHARISDSDITVFICADEAQFHRASGKYPGIYERADFGSLSELQDAFVRDVVEAIGSPESDSPAGFTPP